MVPQPVISLFSAALLNASLGSLYGFSVFLEPLQLGLDASRAAVSAIFSTAAVAFTISMLASPYAYTRLKLSTLASIACGLAAAGMVLSAGVRAFAAVWVGYGILFGLANGIGYNVALQAVSSDWHRNRGLATGVVVAMYAGGAIAAAPLMQWGVDSLGVWGTFAAMGLVFGINSLVVGWLLNASEVAVRPSSEHSSSLIPMPPAQVFWIFWLAFAFAAGAGLMVIGHAFGIVLVSGGSIKLATNGVIAVAAGNVAGRLCAGWLADHLPIRQILAAVMTPAAISLFILVVAPLPATAVAALILTGFAYGSFAGSLPAAIALYYGPEQVGTVFGRVFTAWGLSGLAAPFLAGVIFDLNGSYTAAIAIASASAMLAVASGLALSSPLWSQRIVETRHRLGLSHRSMAMMIAVDGTTLKRWEKGTLRPSREQVQSLKKFVDLGT